MDTIYVCAGSQRAAQNFVGGDLDENPRKLRYIDRADQMQGLSHFVLFVLPSASMHPRFLEIRNMAEERGAIFARVDDSYSRARYAKHE